MRRWHADMALVLVTVIWGSTFIIVKNALNTVGPLVFVAARFWVAGIALALILALRRVAVKITPGLVRQGGLTGLFLAAGFVTQTMGLRTTEAGKAAFITGLSVVLVPVFAASLLRQPPTRSAVVGVILATVGLGLLTVDRRLAFASGDLWVLGCALAFALHIVSTAHFGPYHEVLPFTLTQLFTVALLSSLAALVFEQGFLLIPLTALPAIGYMGLAATALVFGVQTWAQHHTTPTHTALIFSLEPVFAAIFAAAFGGEIFTTGEMVGAGLILLGMVLAEVGERLLNSKEVICAEV